MTGKILDKASGELICASDLVDRLEWRQNKKRVGLFTVDKSLNLVVCPMGHYREVGRVPRLGECFERVEGMICHNPWVWKIRRGVLSRLVPKDVD